MDLTELLARFKAIGTGENLKPETSLQTQAPVDPNAPQANPAVPATSALVTPQGDPNSPPLPGQPVADPNAIPLPQTSDTITPMPSPEDTAAKPSIFDMVSGKLADKQKSGDVGMPNRMVAGSGEDSDYEPDAETPAPGTPDSPKAMADAKSKDGYQLGSKENLESAQKKQMLLNLMGGLSDTGSEFLNNTKAIGDMFTNNPNKVHYGNDTGNYLRSAAESVGKNQKDLVANQPNDPKSQSSVEMRDLARQMGFPVSDNVSAADLDKKFPGLSNIFSAREAAKARAATAAENNKTRMDIARENREGRYDAAKLAADAHKAALQEKTSDSLVSKMKDDLDPDKARGGNLAQNQKQIYQAERLEQLYTEANGDLRNLDSRQMEELAIGINKLLSGSSTGASAQIEALIPKTAKGSSAKLAEWLTNDPHGTDQIKFVQRMSETVDREKSLAQKQVRDAQVKRLSGYGKLKDIDPDRYNSVLQGYGITPEDLEPKSKKSAPAGAKSPAGPTSSESVKMLAPDGTVRMVPKDQVDAALANGGKLAQ